MTLKNSKRVLILLAIVACVQTHVFADSFADKLIASAVFVGINVVLYCYYVNQAPQNPTVAIKRVPRFTPREHEENTLQNFL